MAARQARESTTMEGAYSENGSMRPSWPRTRPTCPRTRPAFVRPRRFLTPRPSLSWVFPWFGGLRVAFGWLHRITEVRAPRAVAGTLLPGSSRRLDQYRRPHTAALCNQNVVGATQRPDLHHLQPNPRID